MSSSRRRRFDGLGILACLSFVVVVTVDAKALGDVVEEVDVSVDAATIAAGFRPGVEWFSVYREDRKIGLIKSRRDRTAAGYLLTTHTELRQGFGDIVLDLETRLDEAYELAAFEAQVKSALVELSAKGRVELGELLVDVKGLPAGPQTLRFDMQSAPRFDQSLRPLLLREELEAGARFRFETFDPTTFATRETQIEYVGLESLQIMGRKRRAHHFRQTVAEQTMNVWLNDLGEVLKEELPGGVFALRESEAEALWGLDEASGAAPAGKDEP